MLWQEGAEEELDIDLTDPDLHKAATKIQASFRGHKARKDDHGAKDDDKPQQWRRPSRPVVITCLTPTTSARRGPRPLDAKA